MRPRNETARDQLPTLLKRHPGAKAAKLAELAKTSPATMNRILAEARADVIRIGRAGRTRYYLRRPLRGAAGTLPLYAVDSQGNASQMGQLSLIAPQGSVLDVAAMGWPVEAEFSDGVWPGLPYPLQDMRPQGFLGRSFARQLAQDLGVSSNPTEWSDDDTIYILSQRGADTSGNLILGDVALDRWLKFKTAPLDVLTPQNCGQGYAQRANQASAMGAVGSSAAGEFPKFTALRELPGSQTPHVIVKFSGAQDSSTVRRWADLLVCEHLALKTICTVPGIESALSRIIQFQGRTFLEVERFDRHGKFGRSPLCSLETIDAAMLSKSSHDWGVLGELLCEQGWISELSVRTVRNISMFGKLIGNTDMHKGNLSFAPGLPMRVAPVYDMLPMMYAPLGGGEIPKVNYAPELPAPKNRDIWHQMSTAAMMFWESAAADERISREFQAICKQNMEVLAKLKILA